jgi:two-component system nitrogen regulation sensor histidine kinase NtrY
MTVANTSLLYNLPDRLNRWARRVGLGGKLAIALAVAALAAGLTTYGALTGSAPFRSEPGTILILLNVDLVLLLILAAVVARRLVRVWIDRRRGSAGSRLHTRFVLLFSLVAVTPAIIVSIFSAVFFSLGIQAWFSDRVRTALQESGAVAESYLKEHRQVITGEVLAMARDLNRSAPMLMNDPQRFQRLIVSQARLRSLSEAKVFDSSGRYLANWSLGFVLTEDPVPIWALDRARLGETVLLTGGAEDKLRAIVKLDRFVDAFLYVGRFVDPKVLSHIEKTKRAVAQYENLEGRRSSFEITFAMMFLLVALLLLLAAIWVGLDFARRLTQPISDLVGAAERVRSGDLDAHVTETPESDEIGTLSRTFNRMTEQLRNQRSGLLDANRQLDERRNFIESVLSGVSSGVIGLDAERRINVANRAASELLSSDLKMKFGEKLDVVIPEMTVLLDKAAARPHRATEGQVTIHLRSGERTLLVRLGAEGDGGAAGGIVVTFDDVTELLSAQRKAAWSDVARRIAHEIKNPLTPIQLAAERLRRKFHKEIKTDPDGFCAYTETIIRQVGDIGRLVDEFSNFARMPAPAMKQENLIEICRRAIFLQTSAHPNIEFATGFDDGPVAIECDSVQIGQALTNLLQNAVDSIEGRDQSPEQELPPGRIEITVGGDSEHGGITVEIADNGRGLPEEARDRLTEPYVTTREKGTGLGLAIVKKIMEDHNGDLVLEDRSGGGALARLVFASSSQPAAAEPGPAADEPATEKAAHGA